MSPQEREAAAKAHYDAVSEIVDVLLPIVTIGAGHGNYAEMVMASRPSNDVKAAGMIAIISGEFSDEDLARFRDFCLGMVQDGRPGRVKEKSDPRNFDTLREQKTGGESS